MQFTQKYQVGIMGEEKKNSLSGLGEYIFMPVLISQYQISSFA